MNITAGKYNSRKIKAPDENIVRPTLSKVRMSVFNTLFSLLGDFEGKSFLDMFGGSGIMGLEALSRGFEKVVVFEKNRTVADIIKSNYKQIGVTPELTIGDSIKLFPKCDEVFDVIYVDPPYMSGIYESVIQKIKESDKTDKSIVIMEHVTELDLSDFEVIKQKKYGDKYLTFIRKKG